jgi:hypothetical protein
MKRARARAGTRCCVSTNADDMSERSVRRDRAMPRANFFDSLETPMIYGFLTRRCWRHRRQNPQLRGARSIAKARRDEALSIPSGL